MSFQTQAAAFWKSPFNRIGSTLLVATVVSLGIHAAAPKVPEAAIASALSGVVLIVLRDDVAVSGDVVKTAEDAAVAFLGHNPAGVTQVAQDVEQIASDASKEKPVA